MGVYIKGMTMEQLRRMGVAGIILSENRLIEVPQMVGNLIGIDACIAEIKRHWCYGCSDYGSHCKYCNVDKLIDTIKGTPVVIEAEGEYADQ